MTLLVKIQFWTLRDNIFIKDSDIGAYSLHDKNENVFPVDHPYAESKELFTVSRGLDWTPRNKRPEKVRDAVKEFEDIIYSESCVAVHWLTKRLNLFFNSGLLATICTSSSSDCCNVDRIAFDRYFVGKLTTDHVTDIIREDNFMIVAYSEPKMTYVFFSKKPRKSEKFTCHEPKLLTVDLIGPIARRLDRRLSISSSKEWALVWWSTRNGEVWPWMPTTSDKECANMVVYALGESSLELVSFSRTEGELVSAMFSHINPNQIMTVEEHISNSKLNNITINICIYQVSRGRFLRSSLTAVPLQGHVVCCQWSPTEERLLLACSDMSIVMFDSVRQISRLTMALFAPIEIAWHPGGTVAILGSEKGQIQCFDIGLSSIKLQLFDDDTQANKKLELSTYFKSQPALLRLIWEGSDKKNVQSNVLCVLFDKGPVTMLTFTLGVVTRSTLSPMEIVSQYLKMNLLDEAIGVLHNLHWSREAEICYRLMMNIFNHLLRKPLGHDTEAQIETTLGFFYDTSNPLPEFVIEEYREQVGRLARRFFHHLLRHERLEKAFLLAVDLSCRDLFLDLHNIAVAKGETTLGDVALSRANQLDSRSMDSTSCESDTTEEEYSELSESDDSPDQAKAIVSHNLTVKETKISEESVRPKQFAPPLCPQSTVPPVPIKRNSQIPLSPYKTNDIPLPLSNPPPLVPRMSEMKIAAPSLPPRRPLSMQGSDRLLVPDKPLASQPISLPINSSILPNHTLEKDLNSDDDVENARIQFVHFGVV